MKDVYGRKICGVSEPVDVRAAVKASGEFRKRRDQGRLVADLVYAGFSMTEIGRRTGLTRNVIQSLMQEFCSHDPIDIKRANQRQWIKNALSRGMSEATIVREMRVPRTLVRAIIEEMHKDEIKRRIRERLAGFRGNAQ